MLTRTVNAAGVRTSTAMYTHSLYTPLHAKNDSGVKLVPRDWREEIANLLASRDERPLQLAGVGNPIKTDDGVGLYIASELRRMRPQHAAKSFKILAPTSKPETIFSKLDLRAGNALILDAVECNRQPGTIILAGLHDTQYGFFATHNVPLRLVPELQSNQANAFILGIQPQSTEIGEILTLAVKASADAVVEAIAAGLESM